MSIADAPDEPIYSLAMAITQARGQPALQAALVATQQRFEALRLAVLQLENACAPQAWAHDADVVSLAQHRAARRAAVPS